ncbi:hypothetical protein SI65_09458 [Aspergillus cristatus]|uniref:Uncharacterized protein n=1 Tax=Aspergillus cristatus TaxID=573508 RepID=A0A1E3B2S0_ASPCR|nr:hypothetical protein SI65_09458 [Aspergillus cristatus]
MSGPITNDLASLRALVESVQRDNPNLTPALTHIESFPVAERYAKYKQMLELLLSTRGKLNKAITTLYKHVQNSPEIHTSIPDNEFKTYWRRAARIHESVENRRTLIPAIRENATTAWGEEQANAVLRNEPGFSIAAGVQLAVNRKFSWDEFVSRLNRVMFDRLTGSRPGRSRSLVPCTTDVQKVVKFRGGDLVPVSREAESHGFLLGR